MEWHLTSPGKEYNRNEGIAVYYHCATGNTHLLSDLAISLVRDLSAGPRSSEYFEEHYGEPAADTTLHELRKIDVVEVV
jgi:hypothetical protein